MSNPCECCHRKLRFIRQLCCAGMKTASDVKTPNSHYVGNSSSSRHGTTQLSSGEGSDSDGCPKEISCHYCESAKKAALSYTSDEFSGRCYLTEEQEVKIPLVSRMRPEIPVLVVVMKKTNVKPYGNLVIRKDYALQYLPCEDTNIILQVPMKKTTWKCKLQVRSSGVSDAGRRNLYLGKFVRDNHVREGDIWLFQPMENVKNGRFMMRVHLLHKASIDHFPDRRTGIGSNYGRTSANVTGVNEQPPTDGEEISSSDHEEHGTSESSEVASDPPFILPGRIRLTPAQEKKVLEKVEEIERELPIYVAIMNKINVCRRNTSPILNFGVRYATTYLEKKHATGHHGKEGVISLVLQRDRKRGTWATEMRWSTHRTGPQLRVVKGWPSFSRANHLREGDLCLFKLMNNEELLKMVVYIIRREKC
ncbi:B3 domain-containing protein Os03g0619600-like [Lolium rigidum]|uniref:B3 domain-containing protein Os03g0619600-like n=1 Tax=Lolium rigidum TaxID=89674 RepID=UPI001F5C0EC1|nr:B3 domain-containing protein Os03g0619600-like [Lolium rigidum]